MSSNCRFEIHDSILVFYDISSTDYFKIWRLYRKHDVPHSRGHSIWPRRLSNSFRNLPREYRECIDDMDASGLPDLSDEENCVPIQSPNFSTDGYDHQLSDDNESLNFALNLSINEF